MARDNTVSLGRRILQIAPQPGRRSCAGLTSPSAGISTAEYTICAGPARRAGDLSSRPAQPVEAAAAVDAKNAPTAPWKTPKARFPQLPQASRLKEAVRSLVKRERTDHLSTTRQQHADDTACRLHLQCRDEAVHAGTASEIDDLLARFERREMKEVTDTCKRVDCVGRDAIEVRRRIAKSLCHGAPHFEVELAVRICRDIRIHALDLALQDCAINGALSSGAPHALGESHSAGRSCVDIGAGGETHDGFIQDFHVRRSNRHAPGSGSLRQPRRQPALETPCGPR